MSPGTSDMLPKEFAQYHLFSTLKNWDDFCNVGCYEIPQRVTLDQYVPSENRGCV